MLFLKFSFIVTILTTASAGVLPPLNHGEIYGNLTCTQNRNSPFTSDCELAIEAIQDGEVSQCLNDNTYGSFCTTIYRVGTCGVALCGAPMPIDCQELAIIAEEINAGCQGYNSRYSVSEGIIGIQNWSPNLANGAIKIYNAVINGKRDGPSLHDPEAPRTGPDKVHESTYWPELGQKRHTLLNRARGDRMPVPHTGLVLESVVESGTTGTRISNIEADAINNGLVRESTNSPLLSRVIRGTTWIDMQRSAEVVFTANATDGYIFDFLPDDYRNIGQTFQNFRNDVNNPQFFGVYVRSGDQVVGRMVFRFLWDEE